MNEPIAVDEARTRVARGAALLDQKRPGWASQIDIGTLQMSDCLHCVLGQLWGAYYRGITALFEEYTLAEHIEAIGVWTYGDSSNPGPALISYQRLQDAWVSAIADRLVVPAVQPADIREEQPA